MEHHHRGEWGSNLGFLMAAVGSAVGLGNIWAFPYKMGDNGGFAFLVIYLILAATVGFSIMLCELAIGRRAGRSVLVSYQQVGGKMGTLLGFLALWVVNLTSGITGLTLGMNFWNALVIGVLGLPGFGLLLLVHWVL